MQIICLVAVIFFLIGFIAAIPISRWPIVKDSFWNLALKDILSVVVPLIVACLVTYVVNERISRSAKRREFVLAHLDKMQEVLRSINDQWVQYMKTQDEGTARSILSEYKRLNRTLHLVKGLSDRHLVDCGPIIKNNAFQNSMLAHKSTVTQDPFPTGSPIYDAATKRKIDTSYERMYSVIDECKINLFA